jgi:excisionase family DNA binding protein
MTDRLPDAAQFALALYQTRRFAGETQPDLAKRAGMALSRVFRLEKGRTPLRADDVERLTEALPQLRLVLDRLVAAEAAKPIPVTAPPPPDPNLPAMVSVPRAAEFLSLSKDHVYDLIAAGKLECRRFGRAIRIPREVLVSLASRQAVTR